ncbi:HAD family phosphatase [Galbitalea sp. SE-J8]|uniref:HAD family hydrolase n=1 Tax=Galbitalea sp. SE-J8 TaxID=3054952 RepID=UPI00259C7DED|nr:HAD family phosphatase [Galbitalea sp. SE-J8]MDM4763446.1 HAD family phosphatase [Galbitalea sp. SE-J8]
MSLLFVFDMDNVLYDYDWRARMTLLSELTGHDLPELRRRWWNEAGEWHAERGGYDADEYVAAFSAAMGRPVSEAEWVRIRAAAMRPWPDSIDVVRHAATLGRVSLLTNNGPLTLRHLDALAPELVEVFGDDRFTSSHYGARKPEPIVFERVLAAYGADAADTFFADDLPENVAGAASVGITAHLFTDAARMRAAVDAFAASRSPGRAPARETSRSGPLAAQDR